MVCVDVCPPDDARWFPQQIGRFCELGMELFQLRSWHPAHHPAVQQELNDGGYEGEMICLFAHLIISQWTNWRIDKSIN